MHASFGKEMVSKWAVEYIQKETGNGHHDRKTMEGIYERSLNCKINSVRAIY